MVSKEFDQYNPASNHIKSFQNHATNSFAEVEKKKPLSKNQNQGDQMKCIFGQIDLNTKLNQSNKINNAEIYSSG